MKVDRRVVEQLAYSLGRKDEGPNIDLAEKISKSSDKIAVKELISLLQSTKVAIRHDAIKVLYEIGDRKPVLISPYVNVFLALFDQPDNWMKWGAMSALYTISNFKPELLADYLPQIIDAMDEGSVITRDHGIYILCNLSKRKRHHEDCMELLLEQIAKAPINQIPMYAEKMTEVISAPYVKKLEKVIESRTDVLEFPAKQKRIEKLMKKIKELKNKPMG